MPSGQKGNTTLIYILIILADDLGCGDVACYNPEQGKIPTPHLDRLAAERVRYARFCNGRLCSPSRPALRKLRSVLEKWMEDTDDQARRLESLEELKEGEPRFVPERDWRPALGSKGTADCEDQRMSRGSFRSSRQQACRQTGVSRCAI